MEMRDAEEALMLIAIPGGYHASHQKGAKLFLAFSGGARDAITQRIRA